VALLAAGTPRPETKDNPMRSLLNRKTAAVAGVAAVAAVALASPSTGKALFDANNAHKVDGLHAVQLNKITYGGTSTVVDNFDTCGWTTVYSRTFAAPKKGMLALTGDVRAERDFDDGNPSLLYSRVTIDGVAVSAPMTTTLGAGNAYEGSIANTGGKVVTSGNHTIALQLQECGTGKAFVMSRQITASWSPFGSAGTAPTFRVAPRQPK
jgi:hypothetical protein